MALVLVLEVVLVCLLDPAGWEWEYELVLVGLLNLGGELEAYHSIVALGCLYLPVLADDH